MLCTWILVWRRTETDECVENIRMDTNIETPIQSRSGYPPVHNYPGQNNDNNYHLYASAVITCTRAEHAFNFVSNLNNSNKSLLPALLLPYVAEGKSIKQWIVATGLHALRSSDEHIINDPRATISFRSIHEVFSWCANLACLCIRCASLSTRSCESDGITTRFFNRMLEYETIKKQQAYGRYMALGLIDIRIINGTRVMLAWVCYTVYLMNFSWSLDFLLVYFIRVKALRIL